MTTTPPSKDSDLPATGPLKGIKVIEFEGLAPVPLCGTVLCDFGATVIRIDKPKQNPLFSTDLNRHQRGKSVIPINLKSPEGIAVAKRLCRKADVIIEPFRPGVMEKFGLGPQDLLSENPRLIYARLTGYGQTGPLSSMAGHDINFLAISGVLSVLGRAEQNPTAPANLVADFGGGSLICAIGILIALLERHQSGKGQVIDSSIVEGVSYLSSFLWHYRSLKMLWGNPRGQNLLDSGYFFYDTYKTKDEKYMAVGAYEPKFFKKFMQGLNLDLSQRDKDKPEAKLIVANTFMEKTQAEWWDIFKDLDACVTPVVSIDDAHTFSQNVARDSYVPGFYGPVPKPTPRLSRTPGVASQDMPRSTEDVLLDEGFTNEEVKSLLENNVVLKMY